MRETVKHRGPPRRAKGVKGSKGGRPPILIDVQQLRGLGQIQSTTKEAALVLGFSEVTLMAKLKVPEYREAWEAGQAEGKRSLRRAMFQSALGLGVKTVTTTETKIIDGKPVPSTTVIETKGVASVAAQIWLSKQHLGMKDTHTVEHEGADVTLFELLAAGRREGAEVRRAAKGVEGEPADDDVPPLDQQH